MQTSKYLLAVATALSTLLSTNNAMGSASVMENAFAAETTKKASFWSDMYFMVVSQGEVTKEDFTSHWQKAIDKGLGNINFIETTIGEEAAQAIAEQISSGKITALWLAECDITPSGMKIILEACCAPTTKVQSLQIVGDSISHRYNGNPLIRDGEAGLIVKLLKKSTTLKSIFIKETALTDVGAANIAEGLKSNNSLEEFTFWQNKDVTEEGLEDLRNAATIKNLDASISDKDVWMEEHIKMFGEENTTTTK